MLSENASSDDVRSQQRSEEFLAVLLPSHVIGQVTQTVPKKVVKKRIIFSAGQDWHVLLQEKSQKIGGKLWQLESIMSLTEIYVRVHQIFDLKPFMTLLVCECGYH